MTTAPKPAREHSYRLSVYQRRANDFYPTPSELAISLALGLSRLGLDLPRIALDPCGGDGALRRRLAPFGVDVRLSDLYPDKYPGADGYVTARLNPNICNMLSSWLARTAARSSPTRRTKRMRRAPSSET
jgi:hypothetical protein